MKHVKPLLFLPVETFKPFDQKMIRVASARQRFCELLIVGNEILLGKTLDTNSHWLAGQITRLGGTVERIVKIGDDLPEIQRGIREALRRKPRILITVGGLGPTYDDKTVKGIALAVGRPLRVNARALRLVRGHYRRAHAPNLPLTSHRLKMATLPAGADVLPNPVGTAPGVKLALSDTTIFALPGVPSEMEAIFSGSVVPFVKRKARGLRYSDFSFKLFGVMESTLAPLLDEVVSQYPSVYVKSHPQGFERRKRSVLEIHFSTRSTLTGRAERNVVNAVALLVRKIANLRPDKVKN